MTFWLAIQTFDGGSVVQCACFYSVTVPVTPLYGVQDADFGPTEPLLYVGDPINITNGNMFLEKTDVSIPTDLGEPIKFTRYYNSYSPDVFASPSAWSISYGDALTVEVELVPPEDRPPNYVPGNVVVFEDVGKRIRFTKSGTGGSVTYTPPLGIHYSLQRDDLTDIYELTKDNDFKYYFSSDIGFLTCTGWIAL